MHTLQKTTAVMGEEHYFTVYPHYGVLVPWVANLLTFGLCIILPSTITTLPSRTKP